VLFGLLFLLVALIGFLFWLWMLVDCATKESDEGNTKIVWILIIVFTHIIGAVVYYFVRRPQRCYPPAVKIYPFVIDENCQSMPRLPPGATSQDRTSSEEPTAANRKHASQSSARMLRELTGKTEP